MDLNDVDLEACTAGDPGAWSAFVDCLSGVIVAAVRRTLHGRGARRDVDVDDAVQEVFVRLVRNEFRLLRSYDPDRAALSTWLTIVARSVTIDHLRRRRRMAARAGGGRWAETRVWRGSRRPNSSAATSPCS